MKKATRLRINCHGRVSCYSVIKLGQLGQLLSSFSGFLASNLNMKLNSLKFKFLTLDVHPELDEVERVPRLEVLDEVPDRIRIAQHLLQRL